MALLPNRTYAKPLRYLSQSSLDFTFIKLETPQFIVGYISGSIRSSKSSIEDFVRNVRGDDITTMEEDEGIRAVSPQRIDGMYMVFLVDDHVGLSE